MGKEGGLQWQGSSTSEDNAAAIRCASWLMDGQWPPTRQSSREARVYCGHTDGEVTSRVGQSLALGASWKAMDGSCASCICCSIRDGTDAVVVGADDGRLVMWLRSGALPVKTERAL